MQQGIEHYALEDALRQCGSNWDASQTHGLLSGRLAIAGADSGFDWLSQVLESAEQVDSRRAECESMLGVLFEATYRQLAERQSEFEPLLPSEDDCTAVRATALAHWCEGFLHGLVAANHDDDLRTRLAAEPLADIIKDMLQITRASADEDDDMESDDSAYTELVEYVRVAAQLVYEELSDLRHPKGESAADALH